MQELRIRTMRADEIAIAVDWAAAEGWNPGLADAACFATVDPGGFLIGELDGAPAATISCVNYDANFVISGSKSDLEKVHSRLAERSVVSFVLPVAHAFHSALIEPMERASRHSQPERSPRLPIRSDWPQSGPDGIARSTSARSLPNSPRGARATEGRAR